MSTRSEYELKKWCLDRAIAWVGRENNPMKYRDPGVSITESVRNPQFFHGQPTALDDVLFTASMLMDFLLQEPKDE
jgi:hypothetical protein